MTYELFAHQHDGVGFLTKQKSGLLAFEQGLGKTLVAIDAFRKVRNSDPSVRLLVICPNSLKRNWVAELEKFAPELSTAIAEGTPVVRRRVFFQSTASVVVTSYETARNEVTSILAFLKGSRVALVLDESHAAKNWKSLTSTAARHFAPHCEFRWLLSGTPVTNTAADLYTQIELLSPGERPLGSLESFLGTVGDANQPMYIKQTFDQMIFRRTKEQCLDLPEKTFTDVRIELPAWQRQLYDDMRDQMVCEIKAMTGREYRAFAASALAKLTRLTQLASNPGLLFPDELGTPAKVEALDSLLSDILSVPSRKVIVWSNYVRSIELLVSRYRDQGAVAIYGGTPAQERQDISDRFQNNETTRILVANPAAAGTGFTFTAATFAIYETLSWRYDHYAQSQDRNHRIGQSEPVTYLRLLAVDTIEEAIVGALEKKAALAGSLLGDSPARTSVNELTKEEMCQFLISNRLPS